MASMTQAIAPIPVPLPPLTSEHHFTDTQWQTMLAIIDAVLPPIVVEDNVTDKRNQLKISQVQYDAAYNRLQTEMAETPELARFKQYLRTRQSDNPRFVHNVKRTFETIPADARKRLGGVLDLLKSALPTPLILRERLTLIQHEDRQLLLDGLLYTSSRAGASR